MPEEMTAEELQKRLQEMREVLVSRTKNQAEIEAIMEQPGGIEVDWDGSCPECGEKLDANDGPWGPIEIPPSGEIPEATRIKMLCRKCYIAQRNLPVPRSQVEPAGIEGVLLTMDKIGVNVRRHGHLKLADLHDQRARDIAEEFISDFLKVGAYGEMPGLWIYGTTGTGKSQLAVCILRELIMKAGLRHTQILYDRGRAMITQLQDCYGTNSVDAFSDRRRKARLWVYEDAGTEKVTQDAFRVLEDIFDRREGHPTIVTSNLSRHEMIKRWTGVVDGWERLKSRIAPYRVIEMTGKDLRFS